MHHGIGHMVGYPSLSPDIKLGDLPVLFWSKDGNIAKIMNLYYIRIILEPLIVHAYGAVLNYLRG